MRATKLIAAAFMAVFAACSDGGTGPSDDRAQFTAELTAYEPYQVAVLVLNGAAPAVGVDVTGTFGGEPVTLMRSADSAVAFMVPQATGAQVLEFSIGGRDYSGTVHVTPVASVQDPGQFLATLADDATLLIDAAAAEIALEPTDDDPRALEMLDMARDSLASFQARLAQLSPAEAQQVADIVNANLRRMSEGNRSAVAAGIVHGTAHGMIPTECRSLATAVAQYRCTWEAFGMTMVDVTFGLGGAAVVAKAFAFIPAVGLTAAAVLGVYGGLKAVRAIRIGGQLLRIHALMAWEIGTEVVDAASGYFATQVLGTDPEPEWPGAAASSPASAFTLGAGMPASSMTTLTRDRAMTFRIAPQLRPVRAEDRLLPVSWLATGLRYISRYNAFIARFDADWQLEFEEPATSYAAPVPAEEIAIEIVGSSPVSVRTLVRDGDRISVTFTSDVVDDIQDFSYYVVYTSDVYPEIRVRYDAQLHTPSYRLGFVSDTTLAGDTIIVYGRTRTTMFLMNDDGTLPPNELFSVGSSSTVPPHVYFNVNGNGGHYVHLEGWLTDPALVADTFDITLYDYMYTETRLLDATIIMHDSAGVYGTSLLGDWTIRNYYTWDNSLASIEHVRYAADGTGTLLSTTYYYSDGTSETDNTQYVHDWRITVRVEEGRPIYTLRRTWDDFWVRTADVVYPVRGFEEIVNSTRSVYTKN